MSDETIYVNDESVESESAALELLRRQRARRSLLEYARSIDIPGAPVSEDVDEELFKPIESAIVKHHRVMLEAIEKAMTEPNGRLIIMAPPGSAKSTYTSVVAPSWALSHWDRYRIILASYASDIAEKHSRKCRALKRDPRENAIWEKRPTLAPDQKAIGQWALTNGSEFMAAGILSGITGNRANGIIIDDPMKGREAADSSTIREKTLEEFNDSLMTRLLPGGWVIIVSTRWHEEDLVGKLLPEDYAGQSGPVLCRDNQVWTVINMPAKAEHEDDPLDRQPGEYLWPEWFPENHWTKFENNPLAKRTWTALYQQRPTADEGVQFKRESFKWYDPDAPFGHPDARPEYMTYYGASDLASKPNGGDFREHGIAGNDLNGDLWFLDWWFGQDPSDVVIAHFIRLVRRWKPHTWGMENGPIDQALGPMIARSMREARVRTTIELLPDIRSKEMKLKSLEAMVNSGRVWLPKNRPWAQRLVTQLCGFPAARYDDAADTAGLMARLIDKMLMPHAPERREREFIKPFTGKWLEMEDVPDWRRIRYS